ncbi:MAG: Wzz/FepE/Etk N-terminal domain-containing protein, partial [Candidatus Methylomirabilales bacterium]
MDFRRFLEAVRRFRLLVICSGLAVGFLAFAASYTLATYQVSSRVLIRPASPEVSSPARPQVGIADPAGVTILHRLGETYSSLLNSRWLAEQVVQRL